MSSLSLHRHEFPPRAYCIFPLCVGVDCSMATAAAVSYLLRRGEVDIMVQGWRESQFSGEGKSGGWFPL